MTPNILIGGPIQNREWILPHWLNAIDKSDYPNDQIHLAMLVNNSKDKTLQLLKDFKSERGTDFRKISLWTANGNWRDNRFAGRFFSYFSLLRNRFLEMRTEEDEVIVSIDSDIIIQPKDISTLVNWGLPMTAGVIPNGPIQAGPWVGVMAYNFMEQSGKLPNGENAYVHRDLRYLQYREYEQSNGLCPHDNVHWDGTRGPYIDCERYSGPVSVGMTGAVSAIRKDILDLPGVEYGSHWQGEDVYFCERIREAGFPVYLDRLVHPAHIMDQAMMAQYLQNMEQEKLPQMAPMPPRSMTEPTDVAPKIEVVKKE